MKPVCFLHLFVHGNACAALRLSQGPTSPSQPLTLTVRPAIMALVDSKSSASSLYTYFCPALQSSVLHWLLLAH